MTLEETIEKMISSDYTDRFKAEYGQLQTRIASLAKVLDGYAKGTLDFEPKCSYTMLNNQLRIMKKYESILESRAKIEEIQL